jgi:hypothetical protein
MGRAPTPIMPKPRTWYTNPRAWLCIAGIFVLIGVSFVFGRNYQSNQQYNAIVAAYERDDADDVMKSGILFISRADSVTNLGTQFIDRYPNDARNGRILEMIRSVQGLVTEDDYDLIMRDFLAQQERDHWEYFDALRATARYTILRIAGMTPNGPSAIGQYGFSVTWYNRSDKTVEEIVFYVEAFNGERTLLTASGKREILRGTVSEARPPSYRTESTWLSVWHEPADRLLLHGVYIRYDDGTEITLPADILETVWD